MIFIWIVPAQTEQKFLQSIQAECVLRSFWQVRCLQRNRKCRIGYPGGCTIGKRPIDLHLMALRALGADVRENATGLDGECVRFEGQDIVFPNRVWELLNRQYWQQFLQKV